MKHFNMNDNIRHFWETAYRQNIAKMIGICYRYTQDRPLAEDLAHDAFLVAIDKSSSFENKGPFEAWLRRIVINVALQYLRAQKKQKSFEECAACSILYNDIPEENMSPENTTFSEAELLKAIDFLPEHHRLVFNLYVIDDFTHAQIGATLGISEGTSKSHLARARKKIRELLNAGLKENKERKRAVLLWLLPYKLQNIDAFYKKQLTDLAIQPQKTISFDKVDFRGASIPTYTPPTAFPKIYTATGAFAASTIAVSLVVIVLIPYFNFYKEDKDPAIAEDYHSMSAISVAGLESKNNKANKFSFSGAKAATFSQNAIIANETTKHSETMKTVNTLGALLIAGSTLTLDTSSLLTISPIGIKKGEIASNTPLELPKLHQVTESATSTPKKKSPELTGTFYASTLFWSPVNNELYLKGNHVKVNLNTQKFNGSGTFTFINKIDYLVVDGTPMKLNETITLTEKKYYLKQLTESEAIKKYVDKGKLIVEISLAE
ncbi:RNA polymerase sigma factor [Runella sp.]|uniref:RNA polymerase sigma factor n=1 Tax=Runella sp. TaxID=1960881 RepID=UPI003D0BDB98